MTDTERIQQLEAEVLRLTRAQEALQHPIILHDLIQKWRKTAERRTIGSKGTVVENHVAFGVGSLVECADELEAVLTAPSEAASSLQEKL